MASMVPRVLAVWLGGLCLLVPGAAFAADPLPIIDAHSQADQHIEFEDIISLMNEAGVSRTILALRSLRKPDQLISFATRHPDRITPAIRTKSGAYAKNKFGKFKKFLRQQADMAGFGALAEVLMWHREKTRHSVTTKSGKKHAPPQVVVPPDDRRVKIALALALDRGWPFIAHIEFASAGADRPVFMAKFEDLLRRHPDHPFVLIHMGLLPFEEVRRLIAEHSNIHFIPAHSDPHAIEKSDNPFTPMFDGSGLAPRWKALMVRHPDRFILGFDNVWVQNWERHYVGTVAVWRQALMELPTDVAHAVAHGNAERLWRLPPAQ